MPSNLPSCPIQAGLRLHEAGDLAEAAKIYRQVLSADPNQPDALHLLGVIAHARGQWDDAVELISAALRLDPDNVAAINNLAGVAKDQGNLEEALNLYDAALAVAPDREHLHSNRGNVLKQLGRFDEAIACFERALALDPRSYAAHGNLGTVYKELGRSAEAEACYRRALAHHPESAETLCNLGIALKERARFSEADTCFHRALTLQPNSDTTHTSLGASLKEQGRTAEAIASHWRALALNPQSHVALNNLGNALKDQGRFAEAAAWFEKAIALNPKSHLAHNNLGSTLLELGRAEEAAGYFRQALGIRQSYHPALSNLLFTLNYLATTDRAALFAEHQRFDTQFGEPLRARIQQHTNLAEPERRLRVGYVSGDFREHSVAYFIEPVFTAHARKDFELFCYANQPRGDAMTERLRGRVEHWREVAGWSDDELAAAIRRDQIDILVDLSGHTARHRLLVFARKPAPIQVTMIGYMQTTGLSAMDYRITDITLDPPGVSEAFNTEELIRLPAGAATFRPPVECPPVNDLPALSNGFVTFASFNNLAKVTPEVIAVWARILHSVPTAKLLLVGRAGSAVLETFEAHGIEARRLELLDRQPLPQYLALHHRVDVLLDTFPYNGGTTGLLAAWMGVPFITLDGEGATARAGGSLLRPLGLSELIASSPTDYLARAVAAVANLPRLAEWRRGLRAKLAPMLGDGDAYTHQLEEAFRAMWRKWCATRPVE